LFTSIISASIGILDVGEKWFKHGDLERHYYEPYMKPGYRNERRGYFPFSHLLDKYAPLMKIIMKYFSCEGRFSRVYSYHIRIIMHFTRVKMLNIPYYLFWSVEKMAYTAQKREYKDLMNISAFPHEDHSPLPSQGTQYYMEYLHS